MNPKFEKILDICIENIHTGKTLEQVLADYPNDSQQLKALLEMAIQLEELPKVIPSQTKLSSTMIRIGQEMAYKHRKLVPRKKWLSITPRLALAAIVILGVIVSFIGVSSLSASSMPGDFLFPVKLATEKVRFLLTFNAKNKAELRLTFSEKRLDELYRLSQQSGSVDVSLLKAMLRQAELALENANLPSEQAVPFLSRLQHTNAYQEDILMQIRPKIDSSSKIEVDRAIEICDMRNRWLTKVLKQETQDQISSGKSQKAQKSKKQNWNWGPGCGCD